MTPLRHLPDQVPAELLDQVLAEVAGLEFHQPRWSMFGRTGLARREVAACGASYAYSGIRHPEAPWPPALDELRRQVSELVGVEFNACLVNRYRDGSDRLGEHSDDEHELSSPWVACVHTGAQRTLRVRLNDEVLLIPKTHGSVTVFDGRLRHSVPPTARPVEAHTSLTFRQINA